MRLHFGYRVFDEIILFLANARENRLFQTVPGNDPALDAAVLMKVLPKFHGSRGRLEGPLKALLAWCVDPRDSSRFEQTLEMSGLDGDRPFTTRWSDQSYRYPRTARRVLRMLDELHVDGFTAFG